MKLTSEPLLTIITPTYNHQDYIAQCVESVLRQTYSNWEQIIIDDGSLDNTANIISGFRDSRICLERQENQGPFELARTYNRALSLAKGELIAILEGDDFWPPDKLGALVSAFLDDDVVLAYGEVADVDAKGLKQRTKSRTARLREGLSRSVLFNDPVGSATQYMFLAEGRCLVSPSTVIIRRTALERIGGFQYVPGLPLTDYPTFMELSLVGKFHYSAQIMGYRRYHQNSITVHHAQRIHEMVSDFTMRFVGRHRDKLFLSSSKRESIQRNWRQAEAKLHFSEGRCLLLRRKWSEARSHFRISLKSNSPTDRLAAIVGFLSSWFHLNVELFMKLGGRADLRSARTSLEHSSGQNSRHGC
jgi:glycosyltransferase involved in cell wall biosynthesis